MPENTQRVALIAEDSRIQARVLEGRLTQAGYSVHVAADGAAALAMARRRKPDVIISDIEMPKMSGYDFCRAVKQDPALKDVPVMLLSTLNDPVDIIKGLDAGADNYVTKPYDLNYLLARIDSLLSSPVRDDARPGGELSVTLAGHTYHVRPGRQQVLNLLVSTFENAVEKNRELHRLNEQLTLAKEKLTQWNEALESLNEQLDSANQRMSRDLQAAARVQQSLLPAEGLELPGLCFAWRYIPCDELAGDFLNFFALDERHVAMFVVDVSGHGAASALLAVAVGRLVTSRASATSLLLQSDPGTHALQITSPAAVAAELNRRFPMETQGNLYFTKAYGVLDRETNELRYVSAGHPPVIHMPKSKPPRFLPGDGFAIGMIDDIEYDEQAVQLEPGDRVYFYSDGVPEAMNEKLEQFSNERMLSVLSEGAKEPLTASVDRLLEAVRAWCAPNGPRDDVSILGCEVESRGAVAAHR